MLKRITYGIIIIAIGFNVGHAQSMDDQQNDPYYLNEGDGTFSNLSLTKQTVDSLLDASWGNRNVDLTKGFEDAKLGLHIAEELKYDKGIIRSHFLLGVANQRMGVHEKSLNHYLTALEMEEQGEGEDSVRVSKILNGIAILYSRQENYELATDYFNRSVRLMQASGNREREGISTINLGLVYQEQGNYEKAIAYFDRALNLFDGTGNEYAKMSTLSSLGDIYAEVGEYEKAKDYLLTSLGYFEAEGMIRNQTEAYLTLSRIHQQSTNNNAKALEYARRSLEKAKSINFKESLIESYRQLASIYENQNDYEQALVLYKQYKAVQDSLLNSERTAKIDEMQTRFDVEQKDRKIELLNKESALKEAELGRQKLWRIFMIIGIALMGVIVGLLYRYNNQKKRANHLLEHKNREIEQQNGALVHLNEEKNEFLGMAAHDLRNPLSGITSVVSLIESEDSISDDEMEEYIGLIGTSADRMLSLINNLLDVNAIEEGGRELEVSEVDLPAILDLTISGEQKHALEKSITLKKDIAPNIPHALADEEALQRVLENLISNAVKYSPENSTVNIGVQGLNERLQVLVKDNGPGIPESEQDQLFKRFSRISTTPTADESSTGLGLFIVRKLVEKMDGNVQCNSVVGKGTEFIVTLPAAVPDIAHVDEPTVS